MIFHDVWISGPIINGLYWPINCLIDGLMAELIPQKILESIWEHPGKILFLHIWTSKNVKFGKDGHRKMMKIRPRIS